MKQKNNSFGIFNLTIKSSESNKTINFGKIENGKLNMFTNFKPYVFADVINITQKDSEIIEVMTVNETTYGMVADLKDVDIIDFIPQLSKALIIYEHQDALG